MFVLAKGRAGGHASNDLKSKAQIPEIDSLEHNTGQPLASPGMRLEARGNIYAQTLPTSVACLSPCVRLPYLDYLLVCNRKPVLFLVALDVKFLLSIPNVFQNFCSTPLFSAADL